MEAGLQLGDARRPEQAQVMGALDDQFAGAQTLQTSAHGRVAPATRAEPDTR